MGGRPRALDAVRAAGAVGTDTGEDISFDPVLNRPPGLEQYDALARLRLPAYRTARRTRGDSIAEPVPGTDRP